MRVCRTAWVLAVIMSAEGIPEPLRAQSRHVASFAYPESAARALGRASERAEWLHKPQGDLVEPEGIDHERARRVVERSQRTRTPPRRPPPSSASPWS